MSKQNNKLKRIKAILFSLVYVAIYYAISMIAQMLYVVWQKGNSGATISEIEINLTNGSYALSVISVIFTLWIYLLIGKMRKKPLGTVVENNNVPPMINIMAAMLAVGVRLIVTVYYSFSQNIELLKKSIDEAAELSPQFTSTSQLLIAAFAIIIVAPLFEEILFRGVIFHELKGVMRTWAANVLQALLFGVAHAVLFQSIFAFVIGVILGIVYHKTGNIKTAAICHGVFNLSVIFTQGELTPVAGVVIAILGILLCACSLFYILANSKK